jgi:hypothetical protein
MNNRFALFPNPAWDVLNIAADGKTIEEVSIYTLAGMRIIYERSPNGAIDISALQTGMYIVEARIENTIIRQKLLVQ